jgi:hypothetical protein
MRERGLSKPRLATLMRTSRTQIGRLLDPNDGPEKSDCHYFLLSWFEFETSPIVPWVASLCTAPSWRDVIR